MRVVVVGGGFAGISAAVTLAEQGHGVELHETRATLGGRVHHGPPPAGFPVPLDNGPHLFSGAYHETFSLLRRLGRDNPFHWIDPLRLDWFLPGGDMVSLKAAALPAPLHLACGLLTSNAFTFREKADLFGTLLALRRAEGKDLTIAQYLSERKCTHKTLQLFWDPFTRAVANMQPEDAPLEALTSTLPKMFFGSRRDSAFAVARVPLGDLIGESVGNFLERHGGHLALRSSVESVQVQDGKVHFAQTTSGAKLHADAWVFAVPPTRLAQLFPDEPWIPSGETLGSSPIVTAHFYLDRSVMDLHLACLPGAKFEWVFNRNRNWDLTLKGQILSLLSSADPDLAGRPEPELLDLAWRELVERCPRAAAAERLAGRVTKEMSATFAWTPASGSLRLPARTPLSNLALAGDWTATGLPATIEGAVLSGRLAAETISPRKKH
jgi:squalene-associated FAD-dependent desaturase